MPSTELLTSTFGAFAIGTRTNDIGENVPDLSAEETRLVTGYLSEGWIRESTAFRVMHSSGRTFIVGSGSAKRDLYVVPGKVQGQENYLVRLDSASVSVTIPAAHATQSRNDEVYLVIQDGAYGSGNNYLPRIALRVGDPGGAAPGPDSEWTAWARLATINSPPGSSNLSNTNRTDHRPNATIRASLLQGLSVENPSSAAHIANKGYVDAIGTNGATANSIMRRDSGGRTSVGAPTSAAHAVTKNYVDTIVHDRWQLLNTNIATAAFIITIPSGNWAQLQVRLRGVLSGVGDLTARVNNNSSLSHTTTIFKMLGNGTTAGNAEEDASRWRICEWSTVTSTAVIDLFFGVHNRAAGVVQYQANGTRISASAGASKMSHSWGRITSSELFTSLTISSTGAGIDSVRWWLFGTRA